MRAKRYASANLEKIRQLVHQLNGAGIFPHGYSTQLAEKLQVPTTTTREILKGRTATVGIVEQIVKDAERSLKLNPTKPRRVDTDNLPIKEIMAQGLLPTGFSIEVGEIVGVSENTVKQIAAGLKRSQKIEEAIRQLASRNKEGELVHRLEVILEAIQQQKAIPEN